MKSGIEYDTSLLIGIPKNSSKGVGFFQIGGGIAGDFHLCVPMLYQDMEMHDISLSYFCHFRSTTSYGSYSGAVPNEKNY
jgi:deoxyhypusine synthase